MIVSISLLETIIHTMTYILNYGSQLVVNIEDIIVSAPPCSYHLVDSTPVSIGDDNKTLQIGCVHFKGPTTLVVFSF